MLTKLYHKTLFRGNLSLHDIKQDKGKGGKGEEDLGKGGSWGTYDAYISSLKTAGKGALPTLVISNGVMGGCNVILP